jgi:hypothetical protein
MSDRPNKQLIDDFLVKLKEQYGTNIQGYAAALGAMMAMLELALDEPEKAKKALQMNIDSTCKKWW